MSIASRTLKPNELQYLDLAKDMALKLDYHLWVIWMRANFSYSLSVRMCTFVGIKMPSYGFYLRMKKYEKHATQEAKCAVTT